MGQFVILLLPCERLERIVEQLVNDDNQRTASSDLAEALNICAIVGIARKRPPQQRHARAGAIIVGKSAIVFKASQAPPAAWKPGDFASGAPSQRAAPHIGHPAISCGGNSILWGRLRRPIVAGRGRLEKRRLLPVAGKADHQSPVALLCKCQAGSQPAQAVAHTIAGVCIDDQQATAAAGQTRQQLPQRRLPRDALQMDC